MKIQRFFANNFLRLDLIDIDLSGHTAILMAGNNEAGKTSVAEAIRFALLGETVRVSKKSDYKEMIRSGTKSGTVSVTIDGTTVTRDIKTAQEPDPDHPYHPHRFLPYLLDAQRFAAAKPGDRRAMLLKLTDTDISGDGVVRRMVAKGCDVALAEEVKPMLRSGFDAAHGEAYKRAADARSQWCGLTGQARYGRVIADGWKPEPPEGYDPAALLDIEKQIGDLTTRKARFENLRGRAQAKLEDAESLMKLQEQAAEYDPAAVKRLEESAAIERNEAAHHQHKVDVLNARLSNAREKVPVPCCECGALLRVSFSGKDVKVEKYQPLPDDEMESLRAELIRVSDLVGKHDRAAKELEGQAAGMRRKAAIAVGGKEPVTAADVQTIKDEITKYGDEADRCASELATLDAQARTLREAAVLVKNAADTEKRAAALHAAVGRWEKVVEALAPDGIPAEILSDAIKPVNDRLRSTAVATGWPQVSIAPAMEVLADGRQYSLLSESARWRADAAIAEAIAYLSGLKLLILDRIDVLDVPSRSKLIGWIGGILGDYDTVLLFGTLKQLPPQSALPAGMTAHWIEAGNIVDVRTEAA